MATPSSVGADNRLPHAAPPTLQSAVADILASVGSSFVPVPPTSLLHPYTPAQFDTESLSRAISTMDTISNILANHPPPTDPKYVTRIKELTNQTDKLLQSQIYSTTALLNIQKMDRQFGLNVPAAVAEVPSWTIDHIGGIFRQAGREFFTDGGDEKPLTITAGGKSAVIDVVLSISQVDGKINMNSLNLNTSSGGDTLFEALLRSSLEEFLLEVQKTEVDAILAETLSSSFKQHVEALMNLDSLAHAESTTGNGKNWFKEITSISKIADDITAKEMEMIKNPIGTNMVPLDLFLNRAHPLALPYLVSSSVSFLVHLSPRSYLTMLQTKSETSVSSSSTMLDPPISNIRDFCRKGTNLRTSDVLVTLELSSGNTPQSTSILTPSFPLLYDPLHPNPVTDYAIPDSHLTHAFTSNDTHHFVLDLGKLVMRREAMCAFTVGDLMFGMNLGGGYSPSYGCLSWLDLLNGAKQNTPKYYYTKTNNSSLLHPPVKFTITNPTETGFIFGKIRVSRIAEVYRILELVREQAWLNDVLKSFEWSDEPHSLVLNNPGPEDIEQDDEEALEQLLKGTHRATHIPVEVALLSSFSSSSIQFTMPIPRLGAPLFSYSVLLDPSSLRGVKVDIHSTNEDASGITGDDMALLLNWKDKMEEIVRRGGTSALPGWIWSKLQKI